jgi:flagellin-like hook-associated protein FlgL
MLSRTFLSTVNRAGARLARTQEELATGRRLLRASDDPVGTSRVLDTRARIAKIAALERNATRGLEGMSSVEGALSEVTALIVEARELALQSSNPPITAEDREAAATQVDNILTRLLAIGNMNDGERYLFAGQESLTLPFAQEGNRVAYRGGAEAQSARINIDEDSQILLTGIEAFGVRGAELGGAIDLDPAIWELTSVMELNGGDGAVLSQIAITDGDGATQTIDLTGAATVGEVLSRINSAGLAIDAGVNAASNGLLITSTGAGSTITIAEVGDGISAAQLGILGEWSGEAFGDDLDPVMTGATPLALLRGGAGITPGMLHIECEIDGVVRAGDVDLSFARSVGDLVVGLARAESANGEDLMVEGVIDPDGRTFTIRSTSPGSNLVVSEVTGGYLAAELGVAGSAAPLTLFDVIVELRNALRSDDIATVRDSLATLDEGHSRNLIARIDVGARVRRAESALLSLASRRDRESTALSDLEDVDLTEAIVRSNEEQIAYQAALTATSRAVSVSLLDFLA